MRERWTLPQLEAQLMRGDWFASLQPDLRLRLLSLGRIKSFAKGDVLLGPDLPPAIFVVLRGTVLCSRISETGQETIYHLGRPGFWFGAALVLEQQPVRVTVTAYTPVQALLFASSDVAHIMAARPEYQASLARLPLTRVRRLLQMLEQAGSYDPMARVAARLHHLRHLDREGDLSLDKTGLNISQALLARMTHLSRATVNRVLGDLARMGIVRLGFRSIDIVDPDRLARLADLTADEL